MKQRLHSTRNEGNNCRRTCCARVNRTLTIHRGTLTLCGTQTKRLSVITITNAHTQTRAHKQVTQGGTLWKWEGGKVGWGWKRGRKMGADVHQVYKPLLPSLYFFPLVVVASYLKEAVWGCGGMTSLNHEFFNRLSVRVCRGCRSTHKHTCTRQCNAVVLISKSTHIQWWCCNYGLVSSTIYLLLNLPFSSYNPQTALRRPSYSLKTNIVWSSRGLLNISENMNCFYIISLETSY